MSAILSIRLPLTEELTIEQIDDCASSWIGDSIWYQFTNTSFPTDQTSGTLIEVNDNKTTWFKRFILDDTANGFHYVAYRLETLDQLNRRWRAEAVFELGQTSRYVYVHQDCGLEDPAAPSQFPDGFRFPRIVAVLSERRLLKAEHGLPAGTPQLISELSDADMAALQELLRSGTYLDYPFLYLHFAEADEPDPSITDAILGTFGVYFSRVAHVLIGRREADLKKWNAICRLTEDNSLCHMTGNRVELYLPQMNYHAARSIGTEYVANPIFDAAIDMLMTTQSRLPLDSPDWNRLQEKARTMIIRTEEEPYNLNMNEALAARLQAVRKQHKLTQGQLGKMVGASTLLISRLERLETIKVKRELIHDIEKALGLEYNELASLETPESRKSGKAKNASTPSVTENGSSEAESADYGFTAVADFDYNTPATSATPRFCFMCGTKLKEGSRFCHQCGVKL